MSEEVKNLASKQTVAPRFQVDIKRVISRALRYWYVIVVSLGVALVVSFFKTRYATKIYPITATILIKEKEES